MTKMTEEQENAFLAGLMEMRGLTGLLETVAGLCGAKANSEYLADRQKDGEAWEAAGIAVTNCANRVSVRRVS